MYSASDSLKAESTRESKYDQKDDDDDYWARYDKTPGPNESPVPQHAPHQSSRRATEDDYYARYSDMQPAMDNDDPAENAEAAEPEGRLLADAAPARGNTEMGEIVHARPTSSQSAKLIAQLEDSAAAQSNAEVAIHQHISTTMKSLFRLAQASGMETEELKRIIKTELQTFSMLEEDS